MDLLEAIKLRHSVRSYTDDDIVGDVRSQLQQLVADCNSDSGLNIQLCLNEPNAFDSMMARYGKFHNVENYIALVGKKGEDLEGMCGYYGEKLVVKAQQLGLNTCWVALSYSKGKSPATINEGEKFLMAIAIGYGEVQGVPHKTKSIEQLSEVKGEMPDWFRCGMEAVQLAPTAMNQQKFKFKLDGNKVSPEPGTGFYSKTDLGIAKYHFEVGAGDGNWHWAK